ncbi:M1 family metallopeptidase [Adhaeribacter pallidiroseus]|uniref:Aminopeptidase N n=1 Tax=Adhaeribacter pallidiroseus TaxID=2072847 RepID=A0A369QK11_9BACT|nr:M1 family aminopeptidase [Adhaeribacter pallidiroseus]RDC63975.1 Membrane alanyl aminopeptidase [Adhaeribacter pallidiroseus]
MRRDWMHLWSVSLLSLVVLAGMACSKKTMVTQSIPLENGVSKPLADYRKAVIRQLGYILHFTIRDGKNAPVAGQETITFCLKKTGAPLQIDFKEKPDHLQTVRVNDQAIPIQHQNEHLVIPAKNLKKGLNTINIAFSAGNLSLNRNEDYLYTLLVPDRARTVFPVFDQPNLKASFTLTLTVPPGWQAVTNAPLLDSTAGENSKTFRFAPSDTMSTYLFSFAAGKFKQVSQMVYGRPMQLLHRETDPDKLQLSLNPIFQIHGAALQFMQDYTQISYPFQKFDFVAIPDFQYGGMEHVGAIDYKAAALFLDEGATQDQKLARSSVISHETAHMWFGDLVTMQWFNDVWMKEVFANFMADKITQVAEANTNYDLKFLVDHLPAAYAVDRTVGANPIRQQLDNLQDAGTLYGNIIYHKAPVMMRQLERLMGEAAFKAGLQEYLKKYAFGNATWPDLIQILDAHTPTDLQAWNQVWVNEAGRPVFNYDLQTDGSKIKQLKITQKAEDNSDRLWPQLFEITLVYPDRLQELTVNMNAREVSVPQATGAATPSFILFNSSGTGYGVFPVADAGAQDLTNLKNPVSRASGYISLYENMLHGHGLTPYRLLGFYRTALLHETEELNLKLVTSNLTDIFWRLVKPLDRLALAEELEKELGQAMEKASASNNKKLLFKTYQSIALTAAAQKQLYRIWEQEQPPAGVKLTEDDYTSLAQALALRDYTDSPQILKKQLARIKNPDRQQRLQFLMPALASEASERDAFFASLQQETNREKEAWVVTALSYLHHPLRQQTSEKYLATSLDLLQEIQKTGDIFFPYAWLQGTFGAYQTPAAANTVRTFLQQHPNYNPKLKAKILQAADDLFRAERLVGK